MPLDDVTLAKALPLLALPCSLGVHPEDGQDVTMASGRFGLYVKHGELSVSLGKRLDVDLEQVLLVAVSPPASLICTLFS